MQSQHSTNFDFIDRYYYYVFGILKRLYLCVYLGVSLSILAIIASVGSKTNDRIDF